MPTYYNMRTICKSLQFLIQVVIVKNSANDNSLQSYFALNFSCSK